MMAFPVAFPGTFERESRCIDEYSSQFRTPRQSADEGIFKSTFRSRIDSDFEYEYSILSTYRAEAAEFTRQDDRRHRKGTETITTKVR